MPRKGRERKTTLKAIVYQNEVHPLSICIYKLSNIKFEKLSHNASFSRKGKSVKALSTCDTKTTLLILSLDNS